MWIYVIITLILSCIIWFFVFFSLHKQYRYATIFTDMLRYYTPLTIATFGLYTIILSISLSIIELIPFLLFGILVTIYNVYNAVRWSSCYSINNYENFLKELSNSKYSVKLFSDYKEEDTEKDKITVFIRHDIDLSLPRLKKIMKLEEKYGLKSTSFFRLHSEKYNFNNAIPIIKELLSKKFEVGYHYEVLSQTNGNEEEAISLFEKELLYLRELANIHVVAAHGDKYNNRNIWSKIDKKKLDIRSAYDLKYDFYITEAGGKDMIKNTGNHIFNKIKEAKTGNIIQVLVHPDWWY